MIGGNNPPPEQQRPEDHDAANRELGARFVKAMKVEAAALDQRLTEIDIRVLAALTYCLNSDRLRAWPSLMTISDLTGYHEDRIKSSLRALEGFGYIFRERKAIDKGQRAVVQYGLTRPDFTELEAVLTAAIHAIRVDVEARALRAGKEARPMSVLAMRLAAKHPRVPLIDIDPDRDVHAPVAYNRHTSPGRTRPGQAGATKADRGVYVPVGKLTEGADRDVHAPVAQKGNGNTVVKSPHRDVHAPPYKKDSKKEDNNSLPISLNGQGSLFDDGGRLAEGVTVTASGIAFAVPMPDGKPLRRVVLPGDVSALARNLRCNADEARGIIVEVLNSWVLTRKAGGKENQWRSRLFEACRDTHSARALGAEDLNGPTPSALPSIRTTRDD